MYLYFKHVSVDLTEDYFQYQRIEQSTENYRSVWRQRQITLSKRSDNVTFSLLQRKNFTF